MTTGKGWPVFQRIEKGLDALLAAVRGLHLVAFEFQHFAQ